MTGLDPSTDVIVEIATLDHRRRPRRRRRGSRPRLHADRGAARRDGAGRHRDARRLRAHRGRSGPSTITLGGRLERPPSRSSRPTSRRARSRCAGTRSGPTAASSRSTSPTSRPGSTTATSTSRPSRSWSAGGVPRSSTSAPDKESTHRAMDDVRASIEELRHYRSALFGSPDGDAGMTDSTALAHRGDRPAHRSGPDLRDGHRRHPRRRSCGSGSTRRRRFARSSTSPSATATGRLRRLRGRAGQLRASTTARWRPWPRGSSSSGSTRGDRVAIAMRNLPEWVVGFWSAIAAGAVAVPLNAWWTGEELAYGLEDSGAKVVFCDTERLERLGPQLAGLTELASIVVVDEHRARRPRPWQPPAATRARVPTATCSATSRPTPLPRASTWTPTTTRRSSTRRGRRGGRRARSARTATPARTS